MIYKDQGYPNPSPSSSTQNEVFQQPEVGSSQTGDGVPSLDSLEPLCATPRIVPANDIIQTFVPYGI